MDDMANHECDTHRSTSVRAASTTEKMGADAEAENTPHDLSRPLNTLPLINPAIASISTALGPIGLTVEERIRASASGPPPVSRSTGVAGDGERSIHCQLELELEETGVWALRDH
ncbi:hypothetical protein Ct61P_14866 [Colletotrichum tofieldiae]|nr:hypothetical protein Ct61P_14866 [Colletotrichum tofieldiae]